MLYSDRKIIEMRLPLNEKVLKGLKAGDEVLLSGVLFTARDQAHQRLAALLRKKVSLPFDLKGQVIYYCGPTRTPPGKAIGSCGPTTSSRMDSLTAPLLRAGVIGMIGKGRRSEEVRKLIRKHKAVYFLATGGTGAFLSKRVISAKAVFLKELGPEAVYRLVVKDFPVIVGIDSRGEDVFDR